MGGDLRIVWAMLGLAALVLAYQSYSSAGPAHPRDVALRYVLRDGVAQTDKVSEADCRGAAGGAWVVVNNEPECLAVVGPAPPAPNGVILVFFDGDVPADRIAVDNSADVRARYERLSKATTDKYGVATIIIGRPGLIGSTGVHLNGGRRDEAELLNQAVDIVKRRYAAARVALAGQSGGARIAAQLLVLGRTDVVCTAMASGAYDVPALKGGGRMATNIFGDPGKSYLVPMQRVDDIERSGARRDILIGDPRDTIVSFRGQQMFAEKLVQAGHKVTLIEANGAGASHHGLSIEGIRVAAACASGGNDAAIKAAALASR